MYVLNCGSWIFFAKLNNLFDGDDEQYNAEENLYGDEWSLKILHLGGIGDYVLSHF